MVSRWEKVLRRIDDYRWEIPTDYKEGMRVPGIIYADEKMIGKIMDDQALAGCGKTLVHGVSEALLG